MRRTSKKLSLNKNTIRHLDNDPLRRAAGGAEKQDTVWDCTLKTLNCPTSPLSCLTKDDSTLCKPISYKA